MSLNFELWIEMPDLWISPTFLEQDTSKHITVLTIYMTYSSLIQIVNPGFKYGPAMADLNALKSSQLLLRRVNCQRLAELEQLHVGFEQ